MAKTKVITVKLTKAGPSAGPFTITTDHGDVVATDVTRKILIRGVTYTVNNNVESLIFTSTGKCNIVRRFFLETFSQTQFVNSTFTQSVTACLWRHLTNIELYNYFYGNIEPYIIEYPFAYQFQDEILQNVKDYTKAYEYLPIADGVFNQNTRIETNNKWFNKAILYNGQQSSGVLELVAKPLHNMKAYMQYPILNAESKTITYTKSDNFYQYNTFWAAEISSQIPLFRTTCESLSIDKIVNQANMDYGPKSFKKATLRAKELKVRHILDNSARTHLVSQFILTPAQISYK
jgi:hypothetical protein